MQRQVIYFKLRTNSRMNSLLALDECSVECCGCELPQRCSVVGVPLGPEVSLDGGRQGRRSPRHPPLQKAKPRAQHKATYR